jgi:hypothetical protein
MTPSSQRTAFGILYIWRSPAIKKHMHTLSTITWEMENHDTTHMQTNTNMMYKVCRQHYDMNDRCRHLVTRIWVLGALSKFPKFRFLSRFPSRFGFVFDFRIRRLRARKRRRSEHGRWSGHGRWSEYGRWSEHACGYRQD